MTPFPADPAAIAIFAGPSLVGSPFAGLLREKLHPPLRAGDLTEVARTLCPGSRLLIIDGEFGQTQAVTPTEIRTAGLAGFQVYGAASMGALRAVECSAVGMVGLGQIYADYAAGRLVADDEVALTYHPDSYEPFTVPLVNIRRYVDLLRGFGAAPGERFRIFREARAVHFRERSFSVLGKIVEQTLPREVADAAHGLLEPHARRLWDVKLADAELAITAIVTDNAPPPDTTLTPVPDEPTRLLQPDPDMVLGLVRERGPRGWDDRRFSSPALPVRESPSHGGQQLAERCSFHAARPPKPGPSLSAAVWLRPAAAAGQPAPTVRRHGRFTKPSGGRRDGPAVAGRGVDDHV